MGGIEWDGIEVVAEILGIEDVEMLVRNLVSIRDFQNKQTEN